MNISLKNESYETPKGLLMGGRDVLTERTELICQLSGICMIVVVVAGEEKKREVVVRGDS